MLHKCAALHSMKTNSAFDWCFCVWLPPSPQRPTRKSQRLRGQKPQQATQEKVVGVPPCLRGSPLAETTPLSLDNARSGSPRSHLKWTDLHVAVETDFLSLRRKYHCAATQAMMSSHHLDFLQKCDEASTYHLVMFS